MKTLLFAVLLSGVPLFAQTAVAPPTPGLPWEQLFGFVPASSTAVTTSDSLLSQLYLANITGSAVTVSITDISTACSSGPCSLWPAVTIAANTVYIVSFTREHAVGGIKWSASTGSAVVGYMSGTYTQAQIASAKPEHRSKRNSFLAVLHLRRSHAGPEEMTPDKFIALVSSFPR